LKSPAPWIPVGEDHAANPLTRSLTILMPRSSDAFSFRVLRSHSSPRSSEAMQRAAVVLPTPAGPENKRWGRSLSFIRLEIPFTMSFSFTISESFFGRYFSDHIRVETVRSLPEDTISHPAKNH